MNKSRLTKLATLLGSVPDEKFNIQSWRATEHGSEGGDEVNDEHLLDTSCGTCGCAIGWACAMPEFQAQGLVWTSTGPALRNAEGVYRAGGWNAVNEFFDIDHDESRNLFSANSYEDEDKWRSEDSPVTPWDVAQRIHEVVKRGEV